MTPDEFGIILRDAGWTQSMGYWVHEATGKILPPARGANFANLRKDAVVKQIIKMTVGK